MNISKSNSLLVLITVLYTSLSFGWGTSNVEPYTYEYEGCHKGICVGEKVYLVSSHGIERREIYGFTTNETEYDINRDSRRYTTLAAEFFFNPNRGSWMLGKSFRHKETNQYYKFIAINADLERGQNHFLAHLVGDDELEVVKLQEFDVSPQWTSKSFTENGNTAYAALVSDNSRQRQLAITCRPQIDENRLVINLPTNEKRSTAFSVTSLQESVLIRFEFENRHGDIVEEQTIEISELERDSLNISERIGADSLIEAFQRYSNVEISILAPDTDVQISQFRLSLSNSNNSINDAQNKCESEVSLF